jgi:hypothetical protein
MMRRCGMKRLGIVAVGLALVVGAIAVVFAVWASVGRAPWEPNASTARVIYNPNTGAKLSICEEAESAFWEANGLAAGIKAAVMDKGISADRVTSGLWLSAVQVRLLALQLINDACPSGGTP